MSKGLLLVVMVLVGGVAGWLFHSCSAGPSRALIRELVRSKYSEKLPASWVSAPEEWRGASGVEFTKIEVRQIGSRQKDERASGGSYWPVRVHVQGACYSVGYYLERQDPFSFEDSAADRVLRGALESRWGTGKILSFDTVTEESVSKSPYGEWVLN